MLNKTLSDAAVDRLYSLRRELLRLRKAVAPLVEVCRRLEHADEELVEPQMQSILPRRQRPYPSRPGRHRFPARGPGLRLRGEPDGGPGAAERDHPQARGVGRDPRRADRDRRHLRHELRAHAGAALEVRLLRRDRRDRGRCAAGSISASSVYGWLSGRRQSIFSPRSAISLRQRASSVRILSTNSAGLEGWAVKPTSS